MTFTVLIGHIVISTSVTFFMIGNTATSATRLISIARCIGTADIGISAFTLAIRTAITSTSDALTSLMFTAEGTAGIAMTTVHGTADAISDRAKETNQWVCVNPSTTDTSDADRD